MRQGLLYEEDVKSVTKVVKACILKLNKEWDREDEQKQNEASSQDPETASNVSSQSQDSQKRGMAMSTQEPHQSYHRTESTISTSSHRSQAGPQIDQHTSRSQIYNEDPNHGESQVLSLCPFIDDMNYALMLNNFLTAHSFVFSAIRNRFLFDYSPFYSFLTPACSMQSSFL